MAADVLWYIIPKEGPYPWEPEGRRPADLGYLQRLAGAVDSLGFDGALLATDQYDVWPLGSALAAVTSPRFQPLLAVHPGLTSPVTLAKQALTFQHLFGPRLLFNVVNGQTEPLRRYGLPLEHDERYELSAEYWGIVKRLTAGEVFDHKGKFYDLKDAGSDFRDLPPLQEGGVPLWFGGSSPAGIEVAAQQVDVYLTWGEPVEQLAEKLTRVRERAAVHGRTLRFGLRLHLIVRDTEDEAWAAADRLLDVTSPETYARQLGVHQENDGEGWRRQFRQHGGRVPARARELETSPNLWPGMGLFRPGPGTAVVGSTKQVVERLKEFEALGVDTFILSGNPLLEEAYRVAETILPALR
ncbi:LLM class flavin-dependent oxidoreductase [Actinoplanes couchii]|uniref:Methanesulfonate monooxygenase n=1 Tax=Actinoplanes couchii TaxID=403638 RepID=A0ABQ3XNF3_9ACTN|nr:LLM class flavin-dependent oxidoreductase [Actinoplanes couchii]MDR6318029.1 alkanesulfonate monooxygenase [Actinoplanes couchii]GID60054.1 methanesulfonate monooxygenase [Actinoplanes couchii]